MLSNCDNSAVVTIFNSKKKQLMQLLRSLFFFLEAYFQFQLYQPPILRKYKKCVLTTYPVIAYLYAFREIVPHADKNPSHIPSFFMQWLLLPGTEWTSPSWMQQFSSFSERSSRDHYKITVKSTLSQKRGHLRQISELKI